MAILRPLGGDRGHHANSCRAIVASAAAVGIETHVFAYAELDAKLGAELGAQKLFRTSTYMLSDGDPVCGWLGAFSTSTRATIEDLRQLEPHLRGDDVVYVNSGQAAQLIACIQLDGVGCAQLFHVVMEFGVDPGSAPAADAERFDGGVCDPREDTRAILYRFASQ